MYTLFGILFLAFVLCTIVTAFIVIALTYFQLAVEDHRWWWRSFLSGGAVGAFVFAYCFFYYFSHSEMSGFLQVQPNKQNASGCVVVNDADDDVS